MSARIHAPVHPVNESYIREWLVVGPFFPDHLARDFLRSSGGEANVIPEEGDTVVNGQGDTLTWKRSRTSRSMIDLLKAIGNYRNATAYAFCILQSDAEQKIRILAGSDDGVAIWINGKRVHYNSADRALFLDQDQFEAILKTGANRCLVKISQGLGNWGFSLRALPFDQSAAISPRFYLSPDYLKNVLWLPNNGWRYQAGDNPEWANPGFDDSSWEHVNPELQPDEFMPDKWQGTGWFRLHLAVDSALFNKPLGLSVWQAGSGQLYLDGELEFTFGADNHQQAGAPRMITFDGKENHVIAVRYLNNSIGKFRTAGFNAGFSLRLGNPDQMTQTIIHRERTFVAFQMLFSSLPLAIGLLHLILFAFFPALRQNLYFALFLFSYAAAVFFDYQMLLSGNIGELLWSFRMHCAMLPFWILFQLWFVYSLFRMKLPLQFRIISVAAFCLGGLAVYKPEQYFEYFGIIYIVTYIEIIRVIALAFFKKLEGVWVVGLAFLVFFFFGLLDTLMDKGILVSLREIENPYAFGSIGFFIAMSIYLSRDFSRTNKRIAEQDVEQKLLEAENARQSKELEAARRLQLSMLPKEVPQLPYLEIAVYMKTATEVGGDYYDFKLHDDGTLTVAVGDATGHGMQAGTMVSATKSLFNALADKTQPAQFLKSSSKAIKEMGLKNMYMALMVVRFSENQVQAASAGMPCPLIYRASTGKVDEVSLKGMPLGGLTGFKYKDEIVRLNNGDTLLLLSDGLEEMFNPKNEILGDERIKNVFRETGAKSPAEIIEQLRKAGTDWADGRDQEDDVTFVLIKYIN